MTSVCNEDLILNPYPNASIPASYILSPQYMKGNVNKHVQCLLRFPLMGCVNKRDKKLFKRLPKRIKKLLKNYQK